MDSHGTRERDAECGRVRHTDKRYDQPGRGLHARSGRLRTINQHHDHHDCDNIHHDVDHPVDHYDNWDDLEHNDVYQLDDDRDDAPDDYNLVIHHHDHTATH